MITTTMMYFIVKLDSIINFFSIAQNIAIGLIGVTIVFMGIYTLALGDKVIGEDERKELHKDTSKAWSLCKKFILALIISSFIKSFLPTTKEMAVIYVIPKIANSEFVNETLPNELKDVYMMSKEWMKDFLKTNKEKEEVKNPVEKKL